MKLKIKNINTRFYIQMMIYLLFGVIGIIMIIYFARQIYNINHINDLPAEIKHQAASLETIQQTFILDVKTNDNFILNRESELKEEFSLTISDIKKNVNNFSHSTFIRNKKEFIYLSDSIKNACIVYEDIFKNLLFDIQTRGIETSGLIKKILESSQTFIDGSIEIKNTRVYEILLNIKSKEYEYLYSLNADKLNDIQMLVEEYRMEIMMLDPELFFVSDFSMEMDGYLEKIEQLKKIDARIGLYSSETGIIKELSDQLHEIISIIEKLEHDVKALEKGKTKLYIILLLSIIGVIFLIIIFFSFLLGRSIFIPLKHIVKITDDLLKGRLSENVLNESDKFEYKTINHNLNLFIDSLKTKQNFVHELHNDNLDADLKLMSKGDEFGKLLLELKRKMLVAKEKQEKYNAENEIRRYMNEGLAKFAEILRTNSDNLERLSDEFISELVKYMESVQGGLFLLDAEKKDSLMLSAAFAYNRKKYMSKTLIIGEGLIGTCAAERKLIHLTEIPEDYVFITSGLGDAPPRNLLLVPVMFEDDLVGVFELASLNPYNENQINLAVKIAESLASTIITVRTNTQTSELLKKSQQQAAEMTEQEEEMRQNMEELKATQEESARREEELEGLLSAINSTFYVTEYDLEGKIISMNENLLLRLNKTTDLTLGKFHTEAFNSADSNLINLDLFSLISSGETKQLIEEIKVDKKIRKLQHHFCPVKSKNGEVVKIINISSDITKQTLTSK